MAAAAVCPHHLTLQDRLLIFGVAFAARAFVLIWATAAVPDIFRWSLDSWEYTAMALSIAEGDWAFYMFVLRTPGYPLVLEGVRSLFGLTMPQIVIWLPFQVCLTAVGALLGAHLIRRLTRNRSLALIGGLVLALDPMILGAEVPFLSEALFIPLLTIAQLFCVRWLERRQRRDLAIAVLAMQALVLTRPGALYWIAIPLLTILLYQWRLWPYAAAMLLAFLVPVAIWTARNVSYTGINTYSTAGVYNLLFYKSVSTESMMTGRTPDEVAWSYAEEIERRIGGVVNREQFPVGDYRYLYVQDPLRYRAMSDLAFEKLVGYHILHLVKWPAHILQNFLTSETLGGPVQRASVVIALPLFAYGVFHWLRKRRPPWQHVLVLGTILYFLLTSTLLLPLPASRYMAQFSVHWALMLALAVTGLAGLIRLRQPPQPKVTRS